MRGSIVLHVMPIVWLAALALGGTPAALAQEPGIISGRVLTETGQPAADATVTLTELRRRTRVEADGTYVIRGVRPGEHRIEAESPRYGIAMAQVVVEPGVRIEHDLVLDLLFHAEPITVSAGPGSRGLEEVAQSVGVVEGRELVAQREATLGETLSEEPGVSSTYFGPGASRPVIRGLGGDRIRILEGGVGTGDASTTSPDHAISHDPLSAERIEIVRGPATLLYGSSAIGGVVNIIDGRIPRFDLDVPITGSLELRGGTVANERSGALSASGGLGPVAWHLGGVARDTDDYDIPGFAAAEPDEREEEPAFGVLPNSALESSNLTGGLSLVGERGFVGFAVSGYDNEYGIPGHGHEAESEPAGTSALAQEAEEEAVRIDMDQRRFDVEGELNRPAGPFEGARLRLGTTDYEHVELEGAEVGTRFTSEAWELRVEAPHRQIGQLGGAWGLQVLGRDFEAIGEEAFVPPTETDTWALFAFEELDLGDLRLQFGTRYENGAVAAAEGEIRERAFDAFSASGGFVWTPLEETAISLSLARSARIPTSEELFSDGPHLATNAFEIGDPDLDLESSMGVDLGVRYSAGRLTGEVSVFANRFGDFIFEAFTGEVEDGLEVIRYSQADALFTGAEAHLDVELLHREPHHLALELQGDFVRAELADTDEPLPRIPPTRIRAGIHYQSHTIWGGLEARRVLEQDRVAEFEEPTDGYTMTDVTLGYRFFAGGLVHDLIFRGTNLTDEEARNHVSFLKELAPLPGRDLSLVYRLNF